MFAIKSFNNSFRGQRKLSSSNAFFNLTNYDLNKENDRLRTFSENNCNLTNIKDLAIVGYYYIQSPDVVKCQFCYVVQHVAETNNSVICNHLRVSPNCPLLRRRITLNQPVSEDELNEILPPESYDVCGRGDEEMSTQPYVGPPLSRRRSRRDSERDSDIRYPEYKLPFNRLKSFDSWPRGIKQRPQELVEAGFFYSGKGDEIVCFSCALGICQLEPDDNPWVEHKKLLINPCSYLDLNRDLLRTNEIKHEELLTQRMLVLEAKQTDQTKQWYDLENEATSSNNDTQCKICLDRQANIVLLPCKHVVTCSQCVFGLNDKCPVCRGNIVEKISLYYS